VNIREKALLNLGGKCKECGSAEKLHLHHIVRLPLSVLWNEKNEYNKRAKEALEHPERFNLLCQNCHMKHHDDERIVRMKKRYILVSKNDEEEVWKSKTNSIILHCRMSKKS